MTSFQAPLPPPRLCLGRSRSRGWVQHSPPPPTCGRRGRRGGGRPPPPPPPEPEVRAAQPTPPRAFPRTLATRRPLPGPRRLSPRALSRRLPSPLSRSRTLSRSPRRTRGRPPAPLGGRLRSRASPTPAAPPSPASPRSLQPAPGRGPPRVQRGPPAQAGRGGVRRPLAHARALTPGLDRRRPGGGGGGGGGAESGRAGAEGESRCPVGTPGVAGSRARAARRGGPAPIHSFSAAGPRAGAPGKVRRVRRPARLAAPARPTKAPCALAGAAAGLRRRGAGGPGNGGGGAGRPDRSGAGSDSLRNFAVLRRSSPPVAEKPSKVESGSRAREPPIGLNSLKDPTGGCWLCAALPDPGNTP